MAVSPSAAPPAPTSTTPLPPPTIHYNIDPSPPPSSSDQEKRRALANVAAQRLSHSLTSRLTTHTFSTNIFLKTPLGRNAARLHPQLHIAAQKNRHNPTPPRNTHTAPHTSSNPSSLSPLAGGAPGTRLRSCPPARRGKGKIRRRRAARHRGRRLRSGPARPRLCSPPRSGRHHRPSAAGGVRGPARKELLPRGKNRLAGGEISAGSGTRGPAGRGAGAAADGVCECKVRGCESQDRSLGDAARVGTDYRGWGGRRTPCQCGGKAPAARRAREPISAGLACQPGARLEGRVQSVSFTVVNPVLHPQPSASSDTAIEAISESRRAAGCRAGLLTPVSVFPRAEGTGDDALSICLPKEEDSCVRV
jgi:hypothetical protein